MCHCMVSIAFLYSESIMASKGNKLRVFKETEDNKEHKRHRCLLVFSHFSAFQRMCKLPELFWTVRHLLFSCS